MGYVLHSGGKQKVYRNHWDQNYESVKEEKKLLLVTFTRRRSRTFRRGFIKQKEECVGKVLGRSY
jgi:hypothetical protein